MRSIDPPKSIDVTLVNKDHGYGFRNFQKFEESILEQVEFQINKNPSKVFIWIDKQLYILEVCEGIVNTRLKSASF